MPIKTGLTEERRKRLDEELKRLVPEIIKLDVEKVILFGSLAKGKIHKASDIDLIIVKRTEKRFLDRLDEFYSRLNPRVGVDIFVYTPEEFAEMKDHNPFLKKAIEEGVIIYEKR